MSTKPRPSVEAVFWTFLFAPLWVGLLAIWWRALVAAVRMFVE